MGNKSQKSEPDRMMGIQISGKNNKPIVSAALYVVSLIVFGGPDSQRSNRCSLQITAPHQNAVDLIAACRYMN